ncbi:MAG: T9SS type A sorting domain-containing protein [Fibrobacteres bacterium]|nr:T9SS type A sorting domain-containing protein [Fibrobacterota bacterium]
MFKSVLTILIIATLGWSVSFTIQPVLKRDGQNRLIAEFAISETTDVAVSIVDVRDSSIVRNLAAGLLGANAPAPLQRNTLHQQLVWDGKDNLGYTLPNPDIMKVRVRAELNASFDRFAGHNPYSFTAGTSGFGGGVHGFAHGPNGSVLVCGNPGAVYHYHIYRNPKIIRQYDADAVYMKTVYPFSSQLGYEKVKGWKPYLNSTDGSYNPVYPNNSLPGWSRSLLDVTKEGSCVPYLQFSTPTGKLFFGHAYNHEIFDIDGGKSDTASFLKTITSPLLPSISIMLFGPNIITPVPGSSDLLVSGIYSGTNSSGHLTGALDTGMYRDGRIFRVNPSTSTATLYLSIDTVVKEPTSRESMLLGHKNYTASLQGVAFDSKGRLYVCDRLHKRIGVYDTTTKALIGSIPLAAGERVSVSPSTGHVFATSRSGVNTVTVKLFKFMPFDSGSARICSLTVISTGNVAESHLFVNEYNGTRRIWVGVNSVKSVMVYNDNVSSFSVFKDFNEKASAQTPGFDRISVDRRNENVYFNDGWQGLYKITDWNNPVVRVCSTNTNERMMSGEVTVSPHGFLFMRGSLRGTGGTLSDISRYTLTSGRHEKVLYSNTGTNVVTPQLYNRMGTVSGLKGIAVSSNGVIATMFKSGAAATNENRVSFYADTGSKDTSTGITKIWPVSSQAGGLRFDLSGNLYVGVRTANPGMVNPAGYASDWAYSTSIGSVVRFPIGFDSSSATETGVSSASSYKIYPIGTAPFSKDATAGGCVCRSPRFDVDNYGRLFLPNAITSQITITDNEGNALLRIGKYGNSDDPASGSNIPLSWPTSVAASEDYIYIADFGGNRIVRAKMVYVIDNYPEITKQGGVTTEDNLSEIAAPVKLQPNPFNPSTNISFMLTGKSRVRVEVYDAVGRVVNTIASDIMEKGSHSVQWNGRDSNGHVVSAGVYYIRLIAGNRESFHKAVFSK